MRRGINLTVCLFQTQSSDEPFPTTSQDLAGFWDLVMIQVDDVNGLFAEIDSLKKNGWKEIQQPASVRCYYDFAFVDTRNVQYVCLNYGCIDVSGVLFASCVVNRLTGPE